MRKSNGEQIDVTPAKRSTIDRQIQFRFHLFAKSVVPMVYITFCKQMEVGLYLPVYRRTFQFITSRSARLSMGPKNVTIGLCRDVWIGVVA